MSLRAVVTRVLSFLRRRQLDADLDDEVRTHLELMAGEFERRGMTPAAARAAARQAFGGVEQMKEVYRDRRGLPWLEVVRQDAVYAGRQLRRAPGFTFAAILTLAVSIGATVTVYSVVDGVLVRPLAYPEASRLVALYARLDPFGRIPVSDAQVRVWRATLKSFDGMALIFGYNVNLSGANEPERVAAARVTPELFRMLGVQVQLGRLLRDDEDVPGRDRIVVVSDQVWRRQFGGDPRVIGKTMTLDGEAHEIVGVLPADFRFPRISHLYSIPGEFPRPDVWKPFALREDDPFSGLNFAAIGRLRSGVTLPQAQAELDALQPALLKTRGPGNATIPGEIVGLREQITGGSRLGLEVLLASVFAVLLIACVNVTHLILARSTTRRQEFAVRSSIGASRGRLVRQLFTEGCVLALAGGAAGTALALLAVRLLVLTAPLDIPRLDEVRVDRGILLFALVISGASAVIVGLLPAWRMSQLSSRDILKAGSGRSGSPAGRSRLSSSLVAAQVSVTVVCAMVAGLLVQSLLHLLSVDKGFEPRRVVTATLDLAGPRYVGRRIPLQRELMQRVAEVPGVTSVAIASQQLLSGAGMNLRVLAEGTTVPIRERPLANFRAVNGDFFRTLGITVERGQTFSENETRRVAVISRSAADQLWPKQDAVGQRFRRGPDDSPPIEVIGVAGDIRASRLDQAPGFIVYVPYSQSPVSQVSLAVKTSFESAGTVSAVREVIRRIDPELPVTGLGMLDDVVAQSVAQRRFLTSLVLFLASAALVIVALGVYGVVSQDVAQRTSEIGVRVALGARRDAVVRMVLGEAWRPVGVGVAAGVPLALASGALIRSLLFGIMPYDSVTVIACCVTMAAVATLAAYAPARRASRVDPMVALRSE